MLAAERAGVHRHVEVVVIVVAAGRLLEEDLQQVFALLAAVDEDLQLAQGLDALLDLPDPDPLQARGQRVEVRPRRGHELHTALAQPAHRAHDVVHGQRRVLDAVTAVVLREQVDLRLLEERPEWFVVGELHGRRRIPHHHRLETGAVLARVSAGSVFSERHHSDRAPTRPRISARING